MYLQGLVIVFRMKHYNRHISKLHVIHTIILKVLSLQQYLQLFSKVFVPCINIDINKNQYNSDNCLFNTWCQIVTIKR